jgi:hypothetical protein
VSGSVSSFEFDSIYGVDFSGAKLAGRNIWIARLEISRHSRTPPRLLSLTSLEALAGTPERDPALKHLVQMIRRSERALWALDFPFGLPTEIMPAGARWHDQLMFLRLAKNGAYDVGLECLERARKLGGALHIRRATDSEAKTPFDCYHYRIIYQFFHGVRDVLGPLVNSRGTTILPFQYARLPRASRVLVEACPSSTLKRLGMPHQNYKQPAGGRLTAKRLRTRRTILEKLSQHVRFDEGQRRTMMRNPGGDAIDAVLAAVGAAQSWRLTDHRAVARHRRYPREGRLYV